MNMSLRVRLALFALTLVAVQPAFAQSRSGAHKPALDNLLLTRRMKAPAVRAGGSIADPVALGLAKAKVYKYSSIDYPGADNSLVFDTNAATAVGEFTFSSASPISAFTFNSNTYRTLVVPGSQLAIATAITTQGVIGATYADLVPSIHGVVDNAGTFTNVDFPGALATELIGMNDAGVIVGD